MKLIKRMFTAGTACAFLLLASGCSTTEESTSYGTLAGAGAGALIGSAVGGSDGWWIGALAGSAVGAASGYLIGSQIEDDETAEQRAIAERNQVKDAPELKTENSKRDESPRYYAYEVSPDKYMVYDNTTGKYWKGVYSIPDAHKGSVAKVNNKWVEVR